MHTAIIAKIDRVEPIEGANTIQKAYVLGTQIIVGKDAKEGDVGILFPSELQLSADYCKENNLYRHTELNKDPTKAGFFEDSRRVRSQPFMKVKSDGYFAPIDSLSYTGADLTKLSIGDQFNELNSVKICEKYISKKTRDFLASSRIKKPKSVEVPFFLPHVDTEQFRYYSDAIPKGALISITAKQHGTSFRCSYAKTIRTLPKWKRVVNKFIPIFNNEKWEHVNGTRRVVLFEEETEKIGFHGSEQFRFDVFEQIKPHLTKGLEIFGEIFGWANGTTIMPKHSTESLKDKQYSKKYGKEITYKYGCLENTFDFMIYRITLTADDGNHIDFTPAQIEDWCKKRGFKHPLQVTTPFIYDGDKARLEGMVEELTERPDKLTEDYIDSSSISEGVVIRSDFGGQTPLFLKNKSYAFKVMEGIAKEDSIDTEDVS